MQTIAEEARQHRSEKPLLTIAIPTYNRARFLRDNLDTLFDQVVSETRVELIVSDNASTDETSAVLRQFESRGLVARYLRNQSNLGADGNILRCFEEARGKYVWVFGDDDVLLPTALAKVLALLAAEDYGLVFLNPFTFREDYLADRTSDRFGRHTQVLSDSRSFARKAGQLIMFISSMIVNKERYATTPARVLQPFVGSSLIHLGWQLPVLAVSRSNLVVHERLVGQRIENGGGWGVCQVYGVNFFRIVDSFLRERPDLARQLHNAMLRYWLPYSVMSFRLGTAGQLDAENMREILEPVHRTSWRYWACVFPLTTLPLSLARAWHFLLIQSGRFTLSRLREFVAVRFTYFRIRIAMRLASLPGTLPDRRLHR